MPIPTEFSVPSSPTRFFVPVAFADPRCTIQEPKTATDTPAGAGAPATGPQDAGTGQPQGPGGPGTPPGGPCAIDNNMLLFVGVGFALMYFLMIRPENKRRKQQQDMLAAIKVGDRVVTLGGMHGVVAALDDKTVALRVDNTKMTFDRTAIARVVRDDAPAPAKS